MKLCERIQMYERKSMYSKSNPPSIKSVKSRASKGSLSSSMHSVSQARADVAAEAAQFQVEIEYLEREKELKRLELEKRLALAKAKENAYKNILDEDNRDEIDKINKDSTQNVKREMNPNIPPFVLKLKQEIKTEKEHNAEIIPPIPAANVTKQKLDPNSDHHTYQPQTLDHALGQLINLQAQQAHLSSLLIDQQRTSQLPVKEPPTFAGNSFEYPAFVTAFDNIISANVSDDKDRLFFLEKYTTGKANEAISGFLATNSDTAYREARKLLKQRFGNPVVVAEDYKRKLLEWKQVNDGDSQGLQDFSDFLVRCLEAMKTMKSMSELNSAKTLQSIVAKLPSYLGVKWCRSAHDKLSKEDRIVEFEDLAKFVKQEAELANDPIFSPEMLKRERRKNIPLTKDNRGARSRPQSGARPSQSLATSTTKAKQNEQRSPLPATATYGPTCLICDGKHAIAKCDTLNQTNADARFELVREKRLCFRCFKSGHVSADCPSKSTCGECGKRHHTLLHGSTPRTKSRDEQRTSATGPPRSQSKPSQSSPDAESAHSNATSVTHNSVGTYTTTLCRIVPVVLYHKDDPNTELKTYALLDDASDTTFVTNQMKNKLGLKGVGTNLNLSTMHGNEVIQVTRLDGLIVERPDRRATVELPKAYARDAIPSRRDQIPTPDVADKWQHLRRIKDKIPPIDDSLEVGILIGSNCPKAIKPKEIITGKSNDPYAVRTILGWCIVGPSNPSEATTDEEVLANCNRIIAREACNSDERVVQFVISKPTKELVNPIAVAKMFELDFVEHMASPTKGLSKEDRRFLQIASEGIHRTEDGHYELPLPLRDENVTLPDNRAAAARRLDQLKRRFESPNGKQYREDYIKSMNSMIDNGYAEMVPPDETTNGSDKNSLTKPKRWLIPHHGLYHPKKRKFRCVFDCAAVYQGQSLNKNLLQGPDLTNNLVGVLSRFRQEPVAFSCDIEGMFHQVRVNEEHRDLLRFLWWPNGDIKREPKEYRMTVHLFGATSSPGCANFALKATADDHETEFGAAAASFLRNDFYVDDGLKSVPTVDEAVKLVENVKEICRKGGFNLHKFLSNSKEVIRSIPEADRADGIKEMDLDLDSLPLERTLGVHWCIESDCFEFRIILQDKPCTRRGILSTISSIFDPLGFVAPLLLEGKSILQDLCREDLGWDDTIPDETKVTWERWRTELMQLQRISIPRCYKPDGFGRVVKTELHHFSDASTRGYGQCSYVRMIDEHDRIHCAFVIGKSRVAPLKPVTIPRLELTAAVCSTRISQQIHRELDYRVNRDFYWTDSKVVLGYINNESRRFHVFVSNRVQEIQDSTNSNDWRYIESKENPADEASRGMKAQELKDSRWILGPTFLWKKETEWPNSDENDYSLSNPQEDPEVKKSVVMATATSDQRSYPAMDERVERFSSWYRAKRAVALCMKCISRLKARIKKEKVEEEVRVEDVERAGRLIIRAAQERAFKDELKNMTNGSEEKKFRGELSKLDALIDEDGIIRAGGRLKHATLSAYVKHPIILPKGAHISLLVIRHFHERVSHQGKGITLNEIRSNGFWVVGGTSAVRSAIGRCVKCRKLRGPVVEQKMCDLPKDRLECCPPFTYCAVDYFGPFAIKEGRKELKRYGVLFTCLSSRAIHLETATSLETDTFLNALRRFLSRRGPVRQIRSDQGTNFVGAQRELKEAFNEMNVDNIKAELQKIQCDWVTFKMNVPAASHMGGVWERQIRTVRSVLSSLLLDNGSQLDDDSLRTFMCEAESIVNSRPLTINQLTDHDSPEPLTPSHLLTMKSKVLLPPPGNFEAADIYARKRWRRVQYLANQFWTRWRKEFLLSLQGRNKWTRTRRNLTIEDIVLIKDENLPRSTWQLARVSDVYPSSDGKVRKVQVALADGCLDKQGKRSAAVRYLDRPVQKLVLLMEA
ncbi:uncharacterized protein LOC116291397 [Actinia tenebrosa]|uniref:Uncharacterized protein LOC116291397 n=1 Tax=Actinia tenebrosa TaxID=6105 RepID=A0A6P8HF90_ACTTE|nr:uncharacterized protein LOC116291397 [Actinia tenebrosa]